MPTAAAAVRSVLSCSVFKVFRVFGVFDTTLGCFGEKKEREKNSWLE